eukprot:280829-Chlamydomonas_euryale.AAC.16
MPSAYAYMQRHVSMQTLTMPLHRQLLSELTGAADSCAPAPSLPPAAGRSHPHPPPPAPQSDQMQTRIPWRGPAQPPALRCSGLSHKRRRRAPGVARVAGAARLGAVWPHASLSQQRQRTQHAWSPVHPNSRWVAVASTRLLWRRKRALPTTTTMRALAALWAAAALAAAAAPGAAASGQAAPACLADLAATPASPMPRTRQLRAPPSCWREASRRARPRPWRRRQRKPARRGRDGRALARPCMAWAAIDVPTSFLPSRSRRQRCGGAQTSPPRAVRDRCRRGRRRRRRRRRDAVPAAAAAQGEADGAARPRLRRRSRHRRCCDAN